MDGFVGWLHPLRFLRGCNPSYGGLTFTSMGLTPIEHASLLLDALGSKYSCEATVIVFEEPPEAFSTADVRSAACSLIVTGREQQDILLTLVVSFSMIVLCELA